MAEVNDYIVDFKEWTVPTKWDDITLRQFEELERYYADKDKKFDVREVIHILCDKTVDEVNALPIEFLEIITTHLAFIHTDIDVEPSAMVEIGGERYAVNVQERLKVGEYVATDTIIKGDPYDYSSILAVLCRKDGEVYDSKFEAELFDNRKEMFSNAPITKIMPIIAFFLVCYAISTHLTNLYSTIEENLKDIAKSLENLENVGVWKKLYLRWRMKALQKRLKSSVKYT